MYSGAEIIRQRGLTDSFFISTSRGPIIRVPLYFAVYATLDLRFQRLKSIRVEQALYKPLTPITLSECYQFDITSTNSN